jgi:pyrroloquinoline quinone (PQQ) biosynthesis protein C
MARVAEPEHRRAFKDVIRRDAAAEVAMPVDDYLADLDRVIADCMRSRDRVIPAIESGKASIDIVKRVALEFYYLGKWYTPEFPVFIANAPDRDALTMELSEHYHHWCQNFADEGGLLRDPNHVAMKVEFCHQLGLSNDDIMSYRPIPETIASVFTTLYYIRRSYEEGLATFGYAGERLAARSGYAKALYEGLKNHYGLTVRNFEVHAYAEPDHGEKAAALLRKVVVTPTIQRLCREAVRNVMLVRDARVCAVNGWLDEPGALRP